MPLEVISLTENDLVDYEHICMAAFSALPLIANIYPGGKLSDEKIKEHAEDDKKTLTSRGYTLLGVRDTETNVICAIAKWRLEDEITKKETREDLHNAATSTEAKAEVPESGIRNDIGAAYGMALDRERSEVMDGVEKYWHLKVLATRPSYQRTGIGIRLLQWGLDRADADALPTYLDSSIFGKSLYERNGFQVRKSYVFNFVDYGGSGQATQYPMVREARPTTTS